MGTATQLTKPKTTHRILRAPQRTCPPTPPTPPSTPPPPPRPARAGTSMTGRWRWTPSAPSSSASCRTPTTLTHENETLNMEHGKEQNHKKENQIMKQGQATSKEKETVFWGNEVNVEINIVSECEQKQEPMNQKGNRTKEER